MISVLDADESGLCRVCWQIVVVSFSTKCRIDGWLSLNFNELKIQLPLQSMHKKVLKGTKWMPRHILPMKDVEGCEKSRLAVIKL